jgi:hypothetical protein
LQNDHVTNHPPSILHPLPPPQTAVLGKVATTVPGARDPEAPGSHAASAPAVLVAEALGSALNDRLKWIRYKAAVADVSIGVAGWLVRLVAVGWLVGW